MDVRWIFFDVGSTLVDETRAYDRRAREMLEGTGIPFSLFDSKRRELAKLGSDGDSDAIRYFGLTKTPWHPEEEAPYADARETLAWLKERGYKLGIIANQNAGTAQRLAGWGLLEFFDAVTASAEAGIAKPHPAIFEMALRTAGCQPGDSAMVGDRLDNDIRPARSLGMKTVWIRSRFAGCVDRDLATGVADRTVDTLSALKEIF